MITGRAGLAEREARLVRHCRAGLRRSVEDGAYRATVLARLVPRLASAPIDMFQAQDWTWAAALGDERHAVGPLAAAIAAGAPVLREGLLGDNPIALVRARFDGATSGKLDLDSTVRSHPFADLHVWSLRTAFAV